jgi:hypothetical protein
MEDRMSVRKRTVLELPRTRTQWAARICAVHHQTVKGVIELGKTLIAAKEVLMHGDFVAMVRTDLPFGPRTAQMLMKIAAHPISNAKHVSLLPASWGTVYELTKLPKKALSEALSDGSIHPQMTRGQATKLLNIKVTHETLRLAAPYYKIGDDGGTNFKGESPKISSAPTGEVASLTLPRIEKLVADLAMSVARGEIVVDAAFEKRVRAAADHLLGLIGR